MQYDIFMSHTGDQKKYYVRRLIEHLENALPGVAIYLDERSNLGSPDVRRRMLRHALLSHCMISVFSHQTAQRAWPIAELMCGFARAKPFSDQDESPLVIDAMPGLTWLEANTNDAQSLRWISDLKKLLPAKYPTCMIGVQDGEDPLPGKCFWSSV